MGGLSVAVDPGGGPVWSAWTTEVDIWRGGNSSLPISGTLGYIGGALGVTMVSLGISGNAHLVMESDVLDPCTLELTKGGALGDTEDVPGRTRLDEHEIGDTTLSDGGALGITFIV